MNHLTTEDAPASNGHPAAGEAFTEWHFQRNVLHINGGREFFGWGHRCIDQPRLMVIDKYFKKDRSMQRTYLVDGKTPCATVAEARAALAEPPQLSDDDRSLLATIGSGWIRPERRGPLIHLADMGFIKWGRDADDEVTCRLTPSGKAAVEPREDPTIT